MRVSEYQYYEFAALDEPLTDKQMKELRALSTRAEITPTSFVNEYHWGDFKGDPRKLIADYFDAFLYYANWGTLWCMFRLPKAAVDLAAFQRFKTPEAIGIVAKGKTVIVDICINDEPGYYDVPYDQTLAPLIPARTALLEGDLGPLYVAWLAAVERHIVDDDAAEPCDTSQLEPMSAGTRTLASFLCVSDKLLRVAFGQTSRRMRVDQPSQIAKWARSLPQEEKDDLLASFIAETASAVRSKLVRQYRASQGVRTAPAKTPPRTAAELRAAAGIE
jgi:hypothetical protein